MGSVKRPACDMSSGASDPGSSPTKEKEARRSLGSGCSQDDDSRQVEMKTPEKPCKAPFTGSSAASNKDRDDSTCDDGKDKGESGMQYKSRGRMQKMIVRSDSSCGDETSLREAVSSDEGLADLLTRLQDHHWQIQKAEVEICTRPDGTDWLLGSGSFGKVYKGILNASLSVAVKAINDQSNSAKISFIEEIVCLMNLRHANVVQFFGAVIDNQHLLLVTEFMPRGSLYEAIAHDREGLLKWHKRGHIIALDIVRGMLFMHARDCLHQDLKSMNVLLGRDWHAKICDVGLCSMPLIQSKLSAPGSVDWTAPEVLSKGPEHFTRAADVFSLGVVLWEIVSGHRPDHRHFPLNCPEDCPEEIGELLRGCLSQEPEDRPSTQDVFNALSRQAPPPTRPLDEPGKARRLTP